MGIELESSACVVGEVLRCSLSLRLLSQISLFLFASHRLVHHTYRYISNPKFNPYHPNHPKTITEMRSTILALSSLLALSSAHPQRNRNGSGQTNGNGRTGGGRTQQQQQATAQQQAARIPQGLSLAQDGSTILDDTVMVNGLPIRFKISAPADQFLAASGVPGAAATSADGTLGVSKLPGTKWATLL
jgi:hypothetical protein